MSDIQKQALIENILDRWLDQFDLDLIKTDWHAFWSDPLQYKNTIVPALVNYALDNK